MDRIHYVVINDKGVLLEKGVTATVLAAENYISRQLKDGNIGLIEFGADIIFYSFTSSSYSEQWDSLRRIVYTERMSVIKNETINCFICKFRKKCMQENWEKMMEMHQPDWSSDYWND